MFSQVILLASKKGPNGSTPTLRPREVRTQAALATISDAAPLAVDISESSSARYPDAVETTAYFVAAEAMAEAGRRSASHATVGVREQDGRLVVTIEDDGAERISALGHLADRVGALGGRLELGPTSLRAEIPCA